MNLTSTTSSDHSGSATHTSTAVPAPRLEPIEQPDSWTAWLAYKFTKWTMGTVITPAKVVQSRLTESVRHAYEMQKVEQKLSLAPRLRFLLKHYVATRNCCAFCVDVAEAEAETHDVYGETLRATAKGHTPDCLSEADRVALRYVEAATEDVHVEDAAFEPLRRHFSDREIVEITWLCAAENFWNRLSGPLRIGSDGLCSV